ncbi:MAG: carbohydrate kinase family protein [Candidatus Nanopelagicales bacterium]
MARVTVVGHPGLDTLVFLPPVPLDLNDDGFFTRNVDTVGGAVGYGARAFNRLGHSVVAMAGLGDDAGGLTVRQVLAREGIQIVAVPDPIGTTRSVNLVHPDGRRTFFYDGGSHMELLPEWDLVQQALRGADLVFASLSNWARGVVAAARAGGIPVAVDLQDVRDPADPYRRDFIAAADLLFASAAHIPDPLAAAQGWFATGPASVVVFGRGPAGALAVSRDGRVLAQPPPGVDLPIIDTTGCGDSLACGFLDGYLFGGLSLEEALRRGQLMALVTASQVGGDELATSAELAALRATLSD